MGQHLTLQYNSDEERERLLLEYNDMYLLEERNVNDGNFLVFTPDQPVSQQMKELEGALMELTTISALREQKDAETEQAILELSMLIGG